MPRSLLTHLFKASVQASKEMRSSLTTYSPYSLLPESPRFLVSKDREEEAAAILVKYHAEGDPNSLMVQAEIAQIRETIRVEMELSKQSWLDLIRTAAMRRRVLITAFIGLFTQLSGNTLLSYYSSVLFSMMGYTTTYAKTRINLANACWSFITATTAALIITRFPRRRMFMTSALLMCTVFIAMTVSLERLQAAEDADVKNKAAGISALFWYFAYSPTYNIGNNALTYTYLIEIWPYAMRSRGIATQQIFGKLAGFFSTNVNSIALDAIKWRYLAIYCGWIFFEFCIVYTIYPETYNRTLEELAFCTFPFSDFSDDPFCTHDHRTDCLVPQCLRTTRSTRRPPPPSRSASTSETPRATPQRATLPTFTRPSSPRIWSKWSLPPSTPRHRGTDEGEARAFFRDGKDPRRNSRLLFSYNSHVLQAWRLGHRSKGSWLLFL